MSTPIFALVIGKGWTDAWYQLPKEERQSIMAQMQELDKRAGAKWIVACNSRWADEEHPMWAVIEYPSIDAYQKKVEEQEKLSWWRYWSAKTILGTRMEELNLGN